MSALGGFVADELAMAAGYARIYVSLSAQSNW